MAKKPTIEKNLVRNPVKWTAKHPAGHLYSMKSLDSLMSHYGLSKEEMEAKGWEFQPQYIE